VGLLEVELERGFARLARLANIVGVRWRAFEAEDDPAEK
jgi:hypothetical protein